MGVDLSNARRTSQIKSTVQPQGPLQDRPQEPTPENARFPRAIDTQDDPVSTSVALRSGRYTAASSDPRPRHFSGTLCAGARGGREPTPGSATERADRHRYLRPNGTARRQRDQWISGEAEIRPVQPREAWVHPRTPLGSPANPLCGDPMGLTFQEIRHPAQISASCHPPAKRQPEFASSMLAKPVQSIRFSQKGSFEKPFMTIAWHRT